MHPKPSSPDTHRRRRLDARRGPGIKIRGGHDERRRQPPGSVISPAGKLCAIARIRDDYAIRRHSPIRPFISQSSLMSHHDPRSNKPHAPHMGEVGSWGHEYFAFADRRRGLCAVCGDRVGIAFRECALADDSELLRRHRAVSGALPCPGRGRGVARRFRVARVLRTRVARRLWTRGAVFLRPATGQSAFLRPAAGQSAFLRLGDPPTRISLACPRSIRISPACRRPI